MNMQYFQFDPAKEFLKPEELMFLQTCLLREQLAFCKEHSPFYRELLRGINTETFTMDDLTELPFTNKDDLAADTSRFLASPMREIEDIVFSSGTTGKPCQIAYSFRDMERLAYNEHRSFYAAGMTSDDRVLLTCTLDRCFVAGLAYYLGVRSIGAAAIRNGLNSLESHAEVIRTLKPTILVGVPSFLRHLGEFLHTEAVDISSVKRLICIGEPIRDEQFESTALGKRLEELWSAKVHSTYASSEIVSSFCECTNHRGGHLLPDLVIAEIIDEQGNRVSPGTCGEVVLTQLQVTGMPLIRFRTGDISFLEETPCPCGRFTPRLGPILGRRAQMLKFKGTTLYPQALYSVLDIAEEVAEYYVKAAGEELSDKLEVVVALKTPGASLERLEKALKAKCRLTVPVTEQPLDEVRRSVFSVSRKPVRFLDLRKQEKRSLM